MSGHGRKYGKSGGLRTDQQRRAPPRPLTFEEQRTLTELYELHHERLVRFAKTSLPAAAAQGPEDIVQTVFAEAALALSIGRTTPGAGWLYDRLRSRIIDQWRRAPKESIVGLESADATEVLRDLAQTPEEDVAGRDFIERLFAAVPDHTDRKALRLLLAGHTEREIAALMGLDYERRQVRERIQRATRQLRMRALDEWPSGK